MLAPAALASTPAELCRDLADGKLDGSYTQEQLAQLTRDAAALGYCHPVIVIVPPTPEQPPAPPAPEQPPAPPGDVAGEEVVVVTPPQQPQQPLTTGVAGAEEEQLAAAPQVGRLPFTGQELTVFLVIGGILIASGALLRSTARQKSRS